MLYESEENDILGRVDTSFDLIVLILVQGQ